MKKNYHLMVNSPRASAFILVGQQNKSLLFNKYDNLTTKLLRHNK